MQLLCPPVSRGTDCDELARSSFATSHRHRFVSRSLALSGSTALLAVTLVGCSTNTPAPVRATATVSRATVTAGVSSTGSLTSTTSKNLGFAKGGKLSSVKVKVGDHVSKGQALASIDTFASKQALKEQQANLAAQEAALDRVGVNPAVTSAQRTLSQAKAVLAATRHQAGATRKADNAAVRRARTQLGVDRKAQDQAEDLLDTAQSACMVSPCPTVGPAELALTGAKQRAAATHTALVAAEQKLKIDVAGGQLAAENAQQAVVTATNGLDAAAADRPYSLNQQRALVRNAEALVRSAQQDITDATLKAPFDGTVAALNGTVGEYLSPSTGTTALAPGSRGAAIPGADAAAGAPASGAAVTRPAGAQFLVLAKVSQLEVVLPFEESDAVEISPKQQVNVAFDALPDLTEPGKVVSVAPSGTAIAGVINYYVTVRLDHTDKRLKVGETARVAVATHVAKNVLSVPNNAVRQQGKDATVIVVDDNGAQHTVAFQPGIVGPDRTEVHSGLMEGQRVIVPGASS